jgi:hypothetical protein
MTTPGALGFTPDSANGVCLAEESTECCAWLGRAVLVPVKVEKASAAIAIPVSSVSLSMAFYYLNKKAESI